MRTYATAQLVGTRPRQCDAWATRHTPAGARVYVLLDGIGSTVEVREWTRRQAVRVAAMTARLGWPADALTRLRQEHAADRERLRYRWDEPDAVAVVAAFTPGGGLEVGWCGDARAYLLRPDGTLTRLTRDHNERQEYADRGLAWGRANIITSSLASTDGEVGNTIVPTVPPGARLLLATDGCYEPIEADGRDLAAELGEPSTPAECAQNLAALAIEVGGDYRDNASCLVADLRP